MQATNSYIQLMDITFSLRLRSPVRNLNGSLHQVLCLDKYSTNHLKAVIVLLELIDVVLWLAVTERLVQRAELPLQRCSSVLQSLGLLGQLTVQLPQPGLTGRQPLLHLLLRGGTEVMEMADLQGEGIATSGGAEAQQFIPGRVQLLHLPLLPVHRLEQSLASGGRKIVKIQKQFYMLWLRIYLVMNEKIQKVSVLRVLFSFRNVMTCCYYLK